jgi:hypothetical protein
MMQMYLKDYEDEFDHDSNTRSVEYALTLIQPDELSYLSKAARHIH